MAIHWTQLRIIDSRSALVSPGCLEARAWLLERFHMRELTKEEKKLAMRTRFDFLRHGLPHEDPIGPKTWGPHVEDVDWSGFDKGVYVPR